MRIVTWNIEFGRRIEQAADELTSLTVLRSAEILLLQEMDETGTRRIADRLGANYVFAAAATHPRTGREMGNSILSPWPIGKPTEIDLPNVARVAGQPRSAVHALVNVEGNNVSTYSIHTETALLSFAERCEQFTTLIEHIDPAGPVIVGGDFNTVRRSEVDELTGLMRSAGLHAVSQRSGATFRRFGRSFTLDHVFARDITALGCGTVPDATASDHLPVWVDLQL